MLTRDYISAWRAEAPWVWEASGPAVSRGPQPWYPPEGSVFNEVGLESGLKPLAFFLIHHGARIELKVVLDAGGHFGKQSQQLNRDHFYQRISAQQCAHAAALRYRKVL